MLKLLNMIINFWFDKNTKMKLICAEKKVILVRLKLKKPA